MLSWLLAPSLFLPGARGGITITEAEGTEVHPVRAAGRVAPRVQEDRADRAAGRGSAAVTGSLPKKLQHPGQDVDLVAV